MNESMSLTIMDDDNGSDEIVAQAELKSSDLNIPPFRPTKTEPMWIKVSHNGKPAGQIKIHCTFLPQDQYKTGDESLALDKRRAVS